MESHLSSQDEHGSFSGTENLTWEVLQKKGWQGPGRCALCQNAEESNFHMFFQCPVSQEIWYELSPWISLTMVFPGRFFLVE